MQKPREYTVIGLMSGTSLDGIDAALIRTDGENILAHLGFVSLPYADDVRGALRACFGLRADIDGRVAHAERVMTLAHADAVRALLTQTGFAAADIDLIGFHGQTIMHDPAAGFTWQIGDGALLAAEMGIDVVNDFRTNDVKNGGQGAPLIPLYHRALAQSVGVPVGVSAGVDLPAAFLNIGGVANVTWIGRDDSLCGFDTGPGNALLNDWVRKHTGAEYDHDGALARQGVVDGDLIAKWMTHEYFHAPAPKSLDRDAWAVWDDVAHLSPVDGAATLAAFTVSSVVASLAHLPEMPRVWYVTGGGRLNPVMMDGLRAALGVPVKAVDDMGWNGDAMEAEGFAWLAVRSLRGLVLSVPETTGCRVAVTGGQLHTVGNATLRVGV